MARDGSRIIGNRVTGYMIKAVIFDMGGVILNLDLDKCVRSFKEKAGCADIEDYLDAFHQKGFIGDMENGTIDVDEFYAECRRHCRPGTTNETIRECFTDLLAGLNEETGLIIRDLSQHYDLYVLSNNNPISAEAFRTIKDCTGRSVADYFKKLFFSFEMKLLKPEPEFFLRALKAIGCKAEEAVFIDDSEKNTAAAEALGIRSILYRPGNLAEDFYRLTENLSTSH